jgi:hypothetical protein
MVEMRNKKKYSENLKETDDLGNIDVDKSIILK